MCYKVLIYIRTNINGLINEYKLWKKSMIYFSVTYIYYIYIYIYLTIDIDHLNILHLNILHDHSTKFVNFYLFYICLI